MKIVLIILMIAVFLSSCGNKEKSREEVPAPEKEKSIEAPVVTKVEVPAGEARTKIIDTGINRVNNIEIACASISGTELKAGEEFSFNRAVGKRSSERGYKDAPIIFHGEKSYGIGGGVCQVSTTLYMAAVNAGLKVTERHKHSESVAYAPGTDATVVYGEKDMRFINNTDDSLFLYLWIQNENLYAKIIRKE